MNDYNNFNNRYGQNVDSNTFGARGMTVNEYFVKTFGWMGLGVAATFLTALLTASTNLVYTVSSFFIFLTIAELGIVMFLSARINKIKVGTARTLFLVYSVLNGLVMSFYFVIYDFSSLIMAFLSAAVYFGMLAFYGMTTKRDLSAWGPKLMIGLIALFVSSIIGMFFGFSFITNLIYCGVGLVVFMLLTAYDTQKLYSYYQHYSGSEEALQKSAIFGALALYLDFINIFLMLVRLLGRSRD